MTTAGTGAQRRAGVAPDSVDTEAKRLGAIVFVPLTGGSASDCTAPAPLIQDGSLITAIHKIASTRGQSPIYSSAKSTLRVRQPRSELSTFSVDILVDQRTDRRIRRGLSRSASNSGGDCRVPASSSRQRRPSKKTGAADGSPA